MTRRAPSAAAPAAALLLILLLAPTALGDHVYSHRYVVVGRVLDADGLPVAGARMDLAAEGFSFEGACATHAGGATDAWGAEAQTTTDARGEFRICLHAHAIAPGGVLAVIARDASGAEIARNATPVDPRFRLSYAELRATGAEGAGEAATAGGHLVAARLWAPRVAGERLEGIPVLGVALPDEEVTVSFVDDRRVVTGAQTRTNAYGDLAVRLPEDPPAAAVLRLDVREHFFFERPDAGGFTGLKLEMPPRAEAALLGGGGAWQSPQGERNPDVRVLPGAQVSLLVVNAEGAPLTFRIEGQPPARTLTARGDHAWVNFTAPEEGELRYWSEEGRAQGMGGRVVVVQENASDVARFTLVPDESAEGFAWRTPGGGEPTLTAAPGQRVAITFVGSKTPHAPRVGDYALAPAVDENRTMHFEAPPEGELEIACLIHPQTMRGVLRVVDPPAAPTTPTAPGAPTGPTSGTPEGATPPTGPTATSHGDAAPTQRTDAPAALLAAAAVAGVALLLRRR